MGGSGSGHVGLAHGRGAVNVADSASRTQGVTADPDGRNRLNLHMAMHQRDGSVREETLSSERIRPHGQEP